MALARTVTGLELINRQEPLAIRVILDTGALAPPASFPPTARRVRTASD